MCGFFDASQLLGFLSGCIVLGKAGSHSILWFCNLCFVKIAESPLSELNTLGIGC